MEEKGKLSERETDASCKNGVSVQEKYGDLGSYGLRENPRKTWRSADSKVCLSQEKQICKQCGKGFQSLKALCGHMACHSEKHRGSSWISENGFSDTEADHHQRRRPSSKRKKCVEKSMFSVSDIDLQEQQEVAICLILLSRNKGGFYSVMESSENNSTKSSSVSKKMKRGGNFSASDSGYFLDESSNEDLHGQKTVKTEEERGNCKSSYQALGNHKPCNRRMNGDYESCENSIEEDDDETSNISRRKANSKIGKKNNREHVCEFCNKVFKNGQALGGHKRSHFIISYDETKSTPTPLMKTTLLDLNLPPPESLDDPIPAIHRCFHAEKSINFQLL